MKRKRYSNRSIWGALLNDIRYGCYKDASKLPPEAALASELGISRTQLRDGLSILEQDGFITRRQGVGTVINRHVINVKTRIDLADEFHPMLRKAGYEPEMLLISSEVVKGDPLVEEKLEISSKTPVLTLTKVVKADGYPAIFCMDYIAFHTIKNFDFSDEDLALPIFIFLEHFCEAGVAMSLAEVNAVTAEAPLSETLLVQIGSPLLQFDIVAYDIENRLIMYSRELHVNGFLKHTFLRKNY